jgi:hypothetical protein
VHGGDSGEGSGGRFRSILLGEEDDVGHENENEKRRRKRTCFFFVIMY